MITVNNMLGENSGTAEMELKGLSTDTKPTGSFSGKKLGENSLFIELDTGDIYYYHGGVWSLMSTGGGGGGGGGGAAPFYVDFEFNDDEELTTETTPLEILAAALEDKIVIARLNNELYQLSYIGAQDIEFTGNFNSYKTAYISNHDNNGWTYEEHNNLGPVYYEVAVESDGAGGWTATPEDNDIFEKMQADIAIDAPICVRAQFFNNGTLQSTLVGTEYTANNSVINFKGVEFFMDQYWVVYNLRITSSGVTPSIVPISAVV